MIDFDYFPPNDLKMAAARAREAGAMLIAGGTTVVDLAKLDVARPDRLIDIRRLPDLDAITHDARSVTIGALATMSQVAKDAGIVDHYPAIAQSLLLAASAQLRNMASVGGNLLQRTRCPYFRDPAGYSACNKREPGSGCSAIGGIAHEHAVLGTSDACIALYPGDFAIALTALGAIVVTTDREIAIEDLFVVPGQTPDRETVLEAGEIVTAIRLPKTPLAERSTYLKVRGRQSYEFASASAAVGLELAPDGKTVADLRVVLGGVATKPWRVKAVEDALRGKPLDEAAVREAIGLAMDGASASGGNAYKIELAPRVVARAILSLGGAS